MMRKKIISIILVLIMVLTTMPAAVFAEDYVAQIGDVKYETLDDAIAVKKNSLTLSAIITILSTEDLYFTNSLNYGEFFLVNDYTHVKYPEGYYCTPVVNDSSEVVGYKIGPAVAFITRNNTATYYETLSKAVAAAQSGDTVILLNDITYDLTKAYYYISWPKVNISLDLNGHNIEGNFAYAAFVVQDVELSIINSGGTNKGMIDNKYASGYGGIMQNGDSTLNLENVTVKSKCEGVAMYNDSNVLNINEGSHVESTSSSNPAVRAGDSSTAGEANTVNINGGTVKGYVYGIFAQSYGKVIVNSGSISANGCALLNNGSNPGETTMVINGGVVDCIDRDNAAIYHPGKGTLTVNDGTIVGGTGIEMRAGTLIIPATVNGEPNTAKITAEQEFSEKANGNGKTLSGVAVGISQHTTNHPVRVEIAGGVIEATNNTGKAFYEVDLQDSNDTDKISASITGGDFKGDIETKHIRNFISGGYYSDDLRQKTQYIASGYECIETNDEEKAIHIDHNDVGLAYKIGARTSGNVEITETNNKDVPQYYETEGELQDAINNITEANQEKIKNDEEVTVSTVTVNNSTSISAIIDDTVKIVANSNDGNKVDAEPGYEMDLPATEGDKTIYTATALKIGCEKTDNVVNGAGVTKTRQTDAKTMMPETAVTQAVADVASDVTETGSAIESSTVIEDVAKVEAAKINQGIAAKALAKGTNLDIQNTPTEEQVAAKDISVFVDTYYQTKVTEDNTREEKPADQTFTLNIKPMYQAYATTVQVNDSTTVGALTVGADSAKIGEPKELNLTGKTVTMKVKLPAGFVADASEQVFVTHTKDNGVKYYYTASVIEERGSFYAVFTNKDGFSSFTFSKVSLEPTNTGGCGFGGGAAPAKISKCPQDETCVYAPFKDTDTKAWYHDGVHFCVENGYMVGVTDEKFEPSRTLSRGMIVTMLWRIEGSPKVDYAMSFDDVADNKWYTEAIRWAQSTKVVEGYKANAFGPNDNVTREQLAAILMRYARYKEIDVSERADLAKFTDTNTISKYALENVQWANAVGIVSGRTETTIVPKGNATRAEAACMVQRFYENILMKD